MSTYTMTTPTSFTRTGSTYPYTGSAYPYATSSSLEDDFEAAIVDAPAGYIKELEIFLVVLFIIINISTIVGNVMALTVFTRIPLSKTVSVIFFTSMALADLSNGIFVMPFSVYSLLHKNRHIPGLHSELGILRFNPALLNTHLMNYCAFSGIIRNTSAKAALFTLIFICFDRFISVYDALRVHTIMTVRNSAIMVTVSWVCALLLAVFPYFVPDVVIEEHQHNATSSNYRYIHAATQCTYRAEEVFDIGDLYTSEFMHAMVHKEKFVYPVKVNVAFFFINILPIVIPTYLIIFFCVAVIVILRRIFKNSKRIIQQIEPPGLKKSRSFRESLQFKELKPLSFRKKSNEKPATTKITGRIEAGYSQLRQGTVSDQLEGKVVKRTQKPCRRITLVNMNAAKSPHISGNRWSQISVKSLKKKTKADNQKKAINTVIMMLLFFVVCYALEWLCILIAAFIYAGVTHNFINEMSQRSISYFFTLVTVMKYLNCAGNPFLYYFRMSQFQKEVKYLINNFLRQRRAFSSGGLGKQKKGYGLIGKQVKSTSSTKNPSNLRTNSSNAVR